MLSTVKILKSGVVHQSWGVVFRNR